MCVQTTHIWWTLQLPVWVIFGSSGYLMLAKYFKDIFSVYIKLYQDKGICYQCFRLCNIWVTTLLGRDCIMIRFSHWIKLWNILLLVYRDHVSRDVRKGIFGHIRPGRLRSACAFAQSDQNFHWVQFRPLRMQCFFMLTKKTLIRLRGRAGWFEFTLGAHVWRYVFWCCGSCMQLRDRSYYINSKTTWFTASKM